MCKQTLLILLLMNVFGIGHNQVLNTPPPNMILDVETCKYLLTETRFNVSWLTKQIENFSSEVFTPHDVYL